MLVNPNPDVEKTSEIRTKLAEAYSFMDYLKKENESLKVMLETNKYSMSAADEN